MDLPSNGNLFHDANLQSRARIGSWGHVGKWEQPVDGREEASSKKSQRIGCRTVRYGVTLAAMLMSPRGLFFNACVPPVLMR